MIAASRVPDHAPIDAEEGDRPLFISAPVQTTRSIVVLSKMMHILILLIFYSPDHLEAAVECPRECECDSLPPNNASWAVYCHQGGMNDTRFADIITRLPPTLRSLSIESPSWRPSNTFRWNDNLNRFTQLRQLRLVDCGLPAMSRSMRLPALELLDLRGNGIEHATMSNFGGLPQLRFLDLSRNQLSILPTGVFTFLHHLQSLSLAHNNITELSTNLLRGLRTLKALHLDGNNIPVKQINDLFTDVPQLEELYLNNCQLTSIANLSLSGVAQLRHLGLAGNQLQAIPTKELQSLPYLAVLDLSSNSIPEVGPCALCGNNVSRLDLSHNLLGLAKEPLHPDAFRNSPLTELDLSFNHMNEFHSLWLGWAQERLRVFKMSGNFLGGFLPELTETLPSLTHFHMAHNAIADIPVIFPPQYYHFELLNISGNQLGSLPDTIQYLLPNLKELDISNNHFSSLSQIAMDYINRLDKVYLSGNPWDCSCTVQHIQHHMKDRYALRHQLNYNDVRCAEPTLVKGHQLLAVSGLHDCAVLFGARYGMTQNSELFIILAALLLLAAVIALVLLCVYCLRERQYKGSYVTREHSRTPLTMNHHISCSSSSSGASEPLTPPMPPPPPKVTAAYFGI